MVFGSWQTASANINEFVKATASTVLRSGLVIQGHVYQFLFLMVTLPI